MTTFAWIFIGISYFVAAVVVALLIGRMIRGRDHHCPAHKQLATDRPLDPGPPLTPGETAVLDQLQEQLR